MNPANTKTYGIQVREGIVEILALLCCLLGVLGDAQAQSSTNLVAGTGKDGVLIVATNATVTISESTSVVGSNPSGQSVLNVSSTNGFAVGDLALIIAMQDPNTNFLQNITGTYEFQRVGGISSGALTFSLPLTNSYSIYRPGVQIQVVHVPEFAAVIVNGTLTAPAWNGTNGGVLALLCQDYLFVGSNGIITTEGKGYRGGAGDNTNGDFCNSYGFQGEGTTGLGVQATAANPQGGGGTGWQDNSGGGGGGYGSSGANGYNGSNNGHCNPSSGGVGGAGGTTFGFADLHRLYLGGGGGGDGGYNNGYGYYNLAHGGRGGNGGGCVVLAANNILGVGAITANGTTGTTGVDGNGNPCSYQPGGGGAGGSVYLLGQITGAPLVEASSLLKNSE